ncbi:MAG: ECF transporter S component [Butyrivibrio sp.]|nr:ECF transporter S component [Butyrivibrio sp.]
MNNNLLTSISENAGFVLGFLAIVLALFIVTYAFEKLARKKSGVNERILNTRTMVVIGVFSAISFVLMFFEVALPFAPSFYKIDLSDLPALIGAFAFGPIVGVLIEFIKILLNLIFQGTTTAFVGELANFIVGCSFVLPASIIYSFKKTRKTAIIATVVGTITITACGTIFNAVYLLPAFAALYGMPLESLIGMGTAINPNVTDVTSFVIMCVAPLNILKGGIDSVITVLIYKRISPILKTGTVSRVQKKAPASNG